MNKTKYLLKNIGILTISNFSSKILVFLLVPLYTSVLSTAEYGSFDLAVSTITLFYPIFSLNVADAIMRYSFDKECSKKEIASIGCKYILLSVAIFGIGMLALNKFKLWPDINGLEIYVFIYYVSYSAYQFLIQFAKGLEKVKEMGTSGVISTFVTILANIIFLLVFRWGLSGFFWANILAQLVAGIYLAERIKIWNYLDYKVKNLKLEKEMLKYSVPLIATVVGWWVNSTADKYVVTFMLGLSANGLISVSYKIPQIINTLQGIFTQAWQISAIKEYGRKDSAIFYGNIFSLINLLMCVACSFLIMSTKPLAMFLYAKEFYVAWKYVPFLLVSSVLNCASGLLGPILSAQKNSKAMMQSAIVSAIVNILMNIILVYLIGIQGATISTLICSYIIYFIRKRAVGKDIEIKGYSIVLLTWILLGIQAYIESYASNYYIEIIIVLMLLLVNMKQLVKVMYKGKNLFLKKEKS